MQKHSTLLSITATDRIGSREPIRFFFFFFFFFFFSFFPLIFNEGEVEIQESSSPLLLPPFKSVSSFRESVHANPTITVAEVCFGEAPFVLPNQNHT